MASVLPANLHWRGANLIGRKHSRDRSPRVGNDQGKIVLASFLGSLARPKSLDIAKNGRAFESSRCADRT
jgi:hypothetical protein